MRTCQYLKRDLNTCDDYADFVLDYGFSGRATCRKHLGTLVILAMGGEGKCMPTNPITVYPTSHWEQRHGK